MKTQFQCPDINYHSINSIGLLYRLCQQINDFPLFDCESVRSDIALTLKLLMYVLVTKQHVERKII